MLDVAQDHWKWHHSIDRIRVAIVLPCFDDILYSFRDKARCWSKIAIFSYILIHSNTLEQGRIQNFDLGGALLGDLGDGSPPAGSRGRAAVGVWERSPQKPEECYVTRLIKTAYGEKKQLHTS